MQSKKKLGNGEEAREWSDTFCDFWIFPTESIRWRQATFLASCSIIAMTLSKKSISSSLFPWNSTRRREIKNLLNHRAMIGARRTSTLSACFFALEHLEPSVTCTIGSVLSRCLLAAQLFLFLLPLESVEEKMFSCWCSMSSAARNSLNCN